MKHTGIIAAALLVVLCCTATSGPEKPDKAQAESLIAKINGVTVMELTADAPIVHYRLLIDGKPTDENRMYSDYSNHLFLAAVPSTSPLGEGAYIHMTIGKQNCMLTAPSFRMGPDNNMQGTIEYTYPKKRVSVDNWVTIYGVTIVQHEKTVRNLEVQIRGAQQPLPQVQK
jgi:hypothetical protein